MTNLHIGSIPVRRKPLFITYAQTPGQRDRARQLRKSQGPKQRQEIKRRLPERGFFADVDPNAEVRNPISFVESPDFTKRPGRYQSDFVWNTDWQAQLDREAAEKKRKQEAKDRPPEPQEGGLGLSRKFDLNSMEVDLSEQLKRRKVDLVDKIDRTVGLLADKPEKIKPFQADSRRWQRGGRFSTRAASIPTSSEEELLAEQAAEEAAEYDRLKQELRLWTLATSVFGAASIYIMYSKEAAISYGVGAVGSYLYLRMLNRSIDSFGGGLGGALGQPRLLIPVVLALGYNRWNLIKAEETGVTLQLLPMLIGFFTYKVAVFTKQGAVLLNDLRKQQPAQ